MESSVLSDTSDFEETAFFSGVTLPSPFRLGEFCPHVSVAHGKCWKGGRPPNAAEPRVGRGPWAGECTQRPCPALDPSSGLQDVSSAFRLEP